MYQIVTSVFRKYVYSPKYDVWWSRVLGTLVCFIAVAFAWIFFRANNVSDAFQVIHKIFSDWGSLYVVNSVFLYGFIGVLALFAKDTIDNFGLNIHLLHSKYAFVRITSVVVLISYILLFGSLGSGAFIYFQF